MLIRYQRWLFAVWIGAICALAALHALHLSADFPNHTRWFRDWAKYTDEGWYGNAAVRAHLFGNWYMAGDFNPAPAVPVWPFLEWLVFCFTGVSLNAARGLAVAFFFANLLLSYLLLRASGPRWRALLALTLLVTSPFLYAFSRLAILEPLLTTLTLCALNLTIRLPRLRRPVWTAAGIGLIFTAMLVTKTTAVFLLPALGWALLLPLRRQRGLALRCALAAAGAAAGSFGLWMAIVVKLGLLGDYRYLFFINTYDKPSVFYWPLLSLEWALHGGFWADSILVPLAMLVALAALLCWRKAWGRALCGDPLFGVSVLAIAGYLAFMTLQNHVQPRYYAVVVVFCFFVVAAGAAALLGQAGTARQLGWAVVALAALAAITNAAWTISYAAFPEYTFIDAAQRLTRYIDAHPNGNRILVATSGDQITMATHLPSLCDDFGTMELPDKLAAYRPGWFASWNDLDPGTLADLHIRYSLEQVATFRAFDDPERNVLVLFKLHPLPDGRVRDEGDLDLREPRSGDKIAIPIQ